MHYLTEIFWRGSQATRKLRIISRSAQKISNFSYKEKFSHKTFPYFLANGREYTYSELANFQHYQTLIAMAVDKDFTF